MYRNVSLHSTASTLSTIKRFLVISKGHMPTYVYIKYKAFFTTFEVLRKFGQLYFFLVWNGILSRPLSCSPEKISYTTSNRITPLKLYRRFVYLLFKCCIIYTSFSISGDHSHETNLCKRSVRCLSPELRKFGKNLMEA